MKYRGMGDGYWVFKGTPGEELVEGFSAALTEIKVGAGFFTGIGAVSEAVIGHFDPATKEYHKETLSGAIEIVSLTGNVSRIEDGSVLVHAHAALSLKDMSMRGGHLFRAVVMPTCEITLRVMKGSIERRLIPELGLKLWQI
jgi:hypothetical protein